MPPLRASDIEPFVMVLTARGDEADIVLALEAGADDYVRKPVGIAELRQPVRAALRRLSVPPWSAPRCAAARSSSTPTRARSAGRAPSCA